VIQKKGDDDLVLSIIFVLICVGIVIYFFNDSKSQNGDKPEKVYKEQEKDEIPILYLDRRIKFLLNQFVKNNVTIKEKFIIPEKIAGAAATEETLNDLMHRVLEHMKLNKNIFLIFHEKNEKAYLGKAGTYGDGGLGNKAIDLVIEPSYSIRDYVAILAHECAHFFMDANNFEKKRGIDNERNTDVLAVLLGFGEYLLETNSGRKFYKGRTIKAGKTFNLYERIKLGYLYYGEIEYIKEKHLKILREGKKQKKIKSESRKLGDTLEIYYENRQSLENILADKVKVDNISKNELEELSSLIYKYQNNNYDATIDKVKLNTNEFKRLEDVEKLRITFKRERDFLRKIMI